MNCEENDWIGKKLNGKMIEWLQHRAFQNIIQIAKSIKSLHKANICEALTCKKFNNQVTLTRNHDQKQRHAQVQKWIARKMIELLKQWSLQNIITIKSLQKANMCEPLTCNTFNNPPRSILTLDLLSAERQEGSNFSKCKPIFLVQNLRKNLNPRNLIPLSAW